MKQSTFIGHIGKFAIYESNGVGKSGNATGETKSIQVRLYNNDDSYLLKKSFSFSLTKEGSYEKARQKAKEYAQSNQ